MKKALIVIDVLRSLVIITKVTLIFNFSNAYSQVGTDYAVDSNVIKEILYNHDVAEIKTELRTRAANIKSLPNVALMNYSFQELYVARIQSEKSIYGTDNRMEIKNVPFTAVKQAARAVIAFIPRDYAQFNTDGSVNLKSYQSFQN